MTETSSWSGELFSLVMKNMNTLAHVERSSKVVTMDQMQTKRKAEKKNERKSEKRRKHKDGVRKDSYHQEEEGNENEIPEEGEEGNQRGGDGDIGLILASCEGSRDNVDPELVAFYEQYQGLGWLESLFGVEVLPKTSSKSRSLNCSRGEILAMAALAMEGGQDVLLSLMVLRSFLIYEPVIENNDASLRREVTIPRFPAFQKRHQDRVVRDGQKTVWKDGLLEFRGEEEALIASPLYLLECLRFLAQHHVLSLTQAQLLQAAIFAGPRGLAASDEDAQAPYLQKLVAVLESAAASVGSEYILFDLLHPGSKKAGTQQQWLTSSNYHLFKTAGVFEEDALAHELFKWTDHRHNRSVDQKKEDVFVLAAGFDYADIIQGLLAWEQQDLLKKVGGKEVDEELLLTLGAKRYLVTAAGGGLMQNTASRVIACGAAAARVGENRSMKTFHLITTYLKQFNNLKMSSSTINSAGANALRMGDKDTLLWLRDNHKLGLRELQPLAASKLRIDLLRWILEELNAGIPLTGQPWEIKLDSAALHSFDSSLHPNAYFTGVHRLSAFATMATPDSLSKSLIPKQAALTSDVEALIAFDLLGASETPDQIRVNLLDVMRSTVWPLALEIGARKGIIEVFEAYDTCQQRKTTFARREIFNVKRAVRMPQATTKKALKRNNEFTGAPRTKPDHRPTENHELTILQIAAIHGNRPVVDWIIKHGQVSLTTQPETSIASELIPDLKADANFAYAADLLLEAAAHYGTVEDFQFAAGLGYTAWGRRFTPQKITYAHVAASQGQIGVLQFLLAHGNVLLDGKKAIADRSGKIPMDFVSDTNALSQLDFSRDGNVVTEEIFRLERTFNTDLEGSRGKDPLLPMASFTRKKRKNGKKNASSDGMGTKLNDLLNHDTLCSLNGKRFSTASDCSEDSDGIVVSARQAKKRNKKR